MLSNFSTIFLSILFEAIPFVMLGTIISSLIEVFISADTINSHLPKNKMLAYLSAALFGIICPVCECAIIPIVRRLIKKNLPIGMAISFMIALPIVNPIVLMSTYYAFDSLIAAFLRGFLGLIAALIIGYSFDKLNKKDALKSTSKQALKLGIAPTIDKAVKQKKTAKNLILSIIDHTSHEVYEVGRLLIVGALISASLQILVPRITLKQFGTTTISSIIFMMLLAFVLSICSEADAFIASSFKYSFSSASVLGFMLFGPMIDIKNCIMLYGSFKKGFATRFIITCTIICFSLIVSLSIAMKGLWL